MAETAKQLEGAVENIVSGLIGDIEARLEDRVTNTITAFLQKRLETFDIASQITFLASVKLDNVLGNMELDGSVIEARLQGVSNQLVETIKEQAKAQISATINNRLASIDINSAVRQTVAAETAQLVTRLNFPDRSIPASAINFDGVRFSGDAINGGIVRKFSSTGIEDRAENCQVTILDAATVVENKLITNHLEVKGATYLEGDIILRGQVPTDTQFFQDLVDTSKRTVLEGLDTSLFSNYSNILFDRIKKDGLDLNRITLNGAEIVKGNQLSYTINDSNLTRVGELKELQVTGEALMNSTLYVGRDRVGIGTMEPGHALSIWDEEVEIGFGKRKRDLAFLGTPGRQSLVISSNLKDNIILDPDGNVRVERIQINNVTLGSVGQEPNTSGERGTVLFNENPEVGKPVGWVCLGGTRWAAFGVIG